FVLLLSFSTRHSALAVRLSLSRLRHLILFNWSSYGVLRSVRPGCLRTPFSNHRICIGHAHRGWRAGPSGPCVIATVTPSTRCHAHWQHRSDHSGSLLSVHGSPYADCCLIDRTFQPIWRYTPCLSNLPHCCRATCPA